MRTCPPNQRNAYSSNEAAEASGGGTGDVGPGNSCIIMVATSAWQVPPAHESAAAMAIGAALCAGRQAGSHKVQARAPAGDARPHGLLLPPTVRRFYGSALSLRPFLLPDRLSRSPPRSPSPPLPLLVNFYWRSCSPCF